MVDTLSTIGYDVTGAPGGVEALQSLKDDKFDLMITDIKMPDVDGLQLLKKVRRYYSQMPVLFVTGVATQDVIGQASPDGFLAKPFRISQIEKLIENALQHKSVGFSSRMPRVLIVEQDEELRNMMSDALNQNQYLTFHATTGRAALVELENGSIDALVADSGLSDTNSLSLMASAKDQDPGILTVLTGDSRPVQDKGTFSFGPEVDVFLPKPFKISELLGLLERHQFGSEASSA
jgi:DNA-binding response OmpR family regulator